MKSIEPTGGISNNGKYLIYTLMVTYSSRKSLFNTWCSICCGYTNSDDICGIVDLSYCSEEEKETINSIHLRYVWLL